MWGLLTLAPIEQAKVCMECLTSQPVALLQPVKYCSEWQNQQVGSLRCVRGYNYTDYTVINRRPGRS